MLEVNPDAGRRAARFAPSPSGRMHLGNVAAALISWLSARSQDLSRILRIEDLDRSRSRREYAELIEDDLNWLGLHYDEGGLEDKGPSAPYTQSRRSHFYQDALERLNEMGLLYTCSCTRADIMASQAPHQSDGRVVYNGNCRPSVMPSLHPADIDCHTALRLFVPDEEMIFNDKVYGSQSVNLARSCGDFIVRRADGSWAYQLAVAVDDALMGVAEVVRGCDLLLSSPQQNYIRRLLDMQSPEYAHIPVLVNSSGQRLSKRDKSVSMEQLRCRYSPEEIFGHLAAVYGLMPTACPVSLSELLENFNIRNIPAVPTLIAPEL